MYTRTVRQAYVLHVYITCVCTHEYTGIHILYNNTIHYITFIDIISPYIFFLLLYDLLLVHVYVREVVEIEGYIAVELSNLYICIEV